MSGAIFPAQAFCVEMRIMVVFSLICFAIGAHAATPPDPVRARAKALYEAAITHYNLSEYGDALKDFKEAYRLVHDPALLFNLAQCHRQLKEFDEARMYRAYRREYPDAPNRSEVDRLVTQMDEAIAERRTQQPPTGTLPAPARTEQPAATTTTAAISNAPASPAGATGSASTTMRSVAAPKKPRSVFKTPWFWAAVAGAAVVIAGVAVGLTLGLEKKDSTAQLPGVRF